MTISTGAINVPYVFPALGAQGLIAPGSTLSIFLTGTDTLATIYADAGATTPIKNPQVANSAGRFTAQATVFWLDDSGAYDVVIHFPDGSQLEFEQLYVLGAATNTSGFAPINSPAFTGTPTAPTPALNDDSNEIATTAYVQGQGYAPINSPGFTGTPTAPTPTSGDDSTKIATTAFVTEATGGISLAAKGLVTWTGSTGAILASAGCIQSVVRSSAGVYTINFSPAFSDANYVPMASYSGDVDNRLINMQSRGASSIEVQMVQVNGIDSDPPVCSFAVFGT